MKKEEMDKDKTDLQRQLDNFEEIKKQDKLKKKEKQEQLFEMMQNNLAAHKMAREQQKRIERSTDHLVNPPEIVNMEVNAKNRMKELRAKKKAVDEVNKMRSHTGSRSRGIKVIGTARKSQPET